MCDLALANDTQAARIWALSSALLLFPLVGMQMAAIAGAATLDHKMETSCWEWQSTQMEGPDWSLALWNGHISCSLFKLYYFVRKKKLPFVWHMFQELTWYPNTEDLRSLTIYFHWPLPEYSMWQIQIVTKIFFRLNDKEYRWQPSKWKPKYFTKK